MRKYVELLYTAEYCAPQNLTEAVSTPRLPPGGYLFEGVGKHVASSQNVPLDLELKTLHGDFGHSKSHQLKAVVGKMGNILPIMNDLHNCFVGGMGDQEKLLRAVNCFAESPTSTAEHAWTSRY